MKTLPGKVAITTGERAGCDATLLAGDVGKESYAKALVDLAFDRFDRLDVTALLVDGGISIARG